MIYYNFVYMNDKEAEYIYYEELLFFIGTEAELIKTFPVIKEMEERKIPYRIVTSGQNDIRKSRVLQPAFPLNYAKVMIQTMLAHVRYPLILQ